MFIWTGQDLDWTKSQNFSIISTIFYTKNHLDIFLSWLLRFEVTGLTFLKWCDILKSGIKNATTLSPNFIETSGLSVLLITLYKIYAVVLKSTDVIAYWKQPYSPSLNPFLMVYRTFAIILYNNLIRIQSRMPRFYWILYFSYYSKIWFIHRWIWFSFTFTLTENVKFAVL